MDVNIFPKVNDLAFRMLMAIFAFYNLHTIMEYFFSGLGLKEWWNNQRMCRIKSTTAWLFGLLAVIQKICGISETVFELTNKDYQLNDSSMIQETIGKFVFDSSAMYIPAMAMLMLNMIALVVGLPKVIGGIHDDAQVGEMVCCVWIVLSFLPFVKGLFMNKGRFVLPWITTLKSAVIACLILCFRKRQLFY